MKIGDPGLPSRYFNKRSYVVEQQGKRFATKHYVDGYWTGTLLSKSKRLAVAKGERHLENYLNF